MGQQKEQKNIVAEEVKQIWNSTHAVVIAVAILKYRHKQFRVKYLADCDLEFHNLEDECPKLLFTLFFKYKISTQAKEKEGGRQPRTKTGKKQEKMK